MRPTPAVFAAPPYSRPSVPQPIVLDLRGNEGDTLDPATLPPPSPELLRRYPDAGPLERALAERWNLTPAQVLVTAGADDGLDRMVRALLGPGRSVVLPVPAFEMTERYCVQSGAKVIRVPWDGGFPIDAVLAARDQKVSLVILTTPNNPTGATIPLATLRAVAAGYPDAVVAVDLAYIEYADDDPTRELLAYGNVLVLRTFSKAWGLAGLRVGWVAGPAEVIGWLRRIGAPYAVSGWSIAVALARLPVGPGPVHLAAVRAEREAITRAIGDDLRVDPSGANFVWARGSRARWLADGLAGFGIATRTFPDDPLAVRIGCPNGSLPRLTAAIEITLRPEAVLFDVDGVLVDVSGSYRAAIVQTCASFGRVVTLAEIRERKAAGDANDDWAVAWRLLGGTIPYEDVRDRFQQLYLGGLWRQERLRVSRNTLDEVLKRYPIALVTGRPRAELEHLLDREGLSDRFAVTVCREDGPLKPDPWPVAEAVRRLGVTRAWMLGDTVDDVRAARRAGVLPLGVLAPGDSDAAALLTAGAARVWADLAAALQVLP